MRLAQQFALPAGIALVALGWPGARAEAETPKRPNVVIVVVDDMGYSDLGAFGGEIRTPNLDALARTGVRFTDFHTSISCSPTRSMLFSGTDNHLAGIGSMDETTAPNQRGKPGYEGYLSRQVVTFPELLRDAGYHTYYAGKWHLGKQPDQIPAARGFERDFTMLDGDGSYFDMTNMSAAAPRLTFTENGRYLKSLPKDYYCTRTYTDKLIGHIESNRQDGKPFLAVLAHQAPHEPYGLEDDWLRKYEGRYDMGWDELRKARLKRMKEIGILPADTALADRMWYVPVAIDLAPLSRAVVGRKMALYASLVENVDFHTGRLIEYLKQIGQYDNTLFVFFSDNGAEGNDKEALILGSPGSRDFLFYAQKWSRTDPADWGRPGSQSTYGPAWAQVSATPFKNFKSWTSEGGHRSPLIVAGAGVGLPGGTINRSLLSVMDVAPTILEIAGVQHPDTYRDRTVLDMQGKSWVPMLSGRAEGPRTAEDWLGWEMFGNRAIRQGNWKLVWEHKPWGSGDWELYDLATDLGERNDVSAGNPEVKQRLLGLWEEYARQNRIILPDRHPFEGLEDKLPTRVPVDEAFPPLKFKKQFVPPAELVGPVTSQVERSAP